MQNLKIQKNGAYLRLVDMHDHPIAGRSGKIPYHRYVLYEKLERPQTSDCHWCGFPLLWKTNLPSPYIHIVNADHVDGDPSNNDPENLVASCCWCNMNRSWAEQYPEFWENWRKWLKCVPPSMRPNLAEIATDFGINVYFEGEKTDGR